MDERDESEPELRLKRLICKRTGEQVGLDEHEHCPYCFGRMAEIEQGQHESFCDYRPGEDPVSFGFPADGARDRMG